MNNEETEEFLRKQIRENLAEIEKKETSSKKWFSIGGLEFGPERQKTWSSGLEKATGLSDKQKAENKKAEEEAKFLFDVMHVMASYLSDLIVVNSTLDNYGRKKIKKIGKEVLKISNTYSRDKLSQLVKTGDDKKNKEVVKKTLRSLKNDYVKNINNNLRKLISRGFTIRKLKKSDLVYKNELGDEIYLGPKLAEIIEKIQKLK